MKPPELKYFIFRELMVKTEANTIATLCSLTNKDNTDTRVTKDEYLEAVIWTDIEEKDIIDHFSKSFKVPKRAVIESLELLEEEGIIEFLPCENNPDQDSVYLSNSIRGLIYDEFRPRIPRALGKLARAATKKQTTGKHRKSACARLSKT